MPGRLRTASRPSSTWIAEASYSTPLGGSGGFSMVTGPPLLSWSLRWGLDMEQAVHRGEEPR